MRGFQNNQGTFFHCSEIGERNWVLKLVSSGDVVPAARNVTKNPSQRLDTGIIPTPWWFTQECEQQLLSIGDDGKLPSTSPPASTTPQNCTETEAEAAAEKEKNIALTPEELRAKLKSQLEYYFSRENLIQDRYLRSQMDSDQFVLVSVVASFPKISQLTEDLDLIVSVLKESRALQINDINTKVRAAHKRTTLLLREIPEFTDEKEVKGMFIGCPKYTSLSYGLNNSWYVTFETEEATQLAFLHLQNLRKSFNGKPICVRIKSGPAPLTDCGDHGRYSPGKATAATATTTATTTTADLTGGVFTVSTSTGTITGISNTVSLGISSTQKLSPNTSLELNLDQLMGPFGYTVRAIYQPKNSEPPAAAVSPDKVPLPEISTTDCNHTADGKTVLGPPSTEIVGSMLSAAAEANETKKREKENQMLQYQQIMESLASTNGTGAARITDTPFIMRPPALKRYISQESAADIEAAIDIQRFARSERTERKESKPPAPQQNHYEDSYSHHSAAPAPLVQPTQMLPPRNSGYKGQNYIPNYQPGQTRSYSEKKDYSSQYNNGSSYNTPNTPNNNNTDRSSNYQEKRGGYGSGERKKYEPGSRDIRYETKPRQVDGGYRRTEGRSLTDNRSYYQQNSASSGGERSSGGYYRSNTTTTTSTSSYSGGAEKPFRKGPRTSSNYSISTSGSSTYHHPAPATPAATASGASNNNNSAEGYTEYYHNSGYQGQGGQGGQGGQETHHHPTSSSSYGYHQQNHAQQPLRTIIERKNENPSSSSSSYAPRNSPHQPQYHQPAPRLSAGSAHGHGGSGSVSGTLNASPNQLSTSQSDVSKDLNGEGAAARKKAVSESSEYNFVDGDFPSLVEKEKIQKEKAKEKAKFSAVVAGKRNEEETKKSYAQTLKKNSTSEATPPK